MEVSHESFVFASSTSSFCWKFPTKAPFSHLLFSDFEGRLSRKLRFHIFNFQFWREVSHESSVLHIFSFHFLVSHESSAFTSSSFRFWGWSRRTKAPFSLLQLSVFDGSLAQKLRCGKAGVACFGARSVFEEGFGAEKSWDDTRVRWEELRWCETSWQELRSAEEMWEELRRCERGEKRWGDIRWADISCGELRRVEKSCENSAKIMRKAQVTWEERRAVVISWEEMRKGEKTWDAMRWDEVKKLRRHEMRWGGMTQTVVTIGRNEQFPREAAMQ